MASDAYIQAAKQANRQPTTYMSVESADGQTLYYTTQGQWSGSETLTRVDTVSEPGTIINEYSRVFSNGTPATVLFDTLTLASDVEAFGKTISNLNAYIELSLTTGDDWEDAFPFNFDMSSRLQIDVGGVISFSDTLTASYGGGTTVGETGFISKVLGYTLPAFLDIGAADAITLTLDVISVSNLRQITTNAVAAVNSIDFEEVSTLNTTIVESPVNGSECLVETSAIDFGEVITTNPTISIDDITDAGTLIAYSYEYSDDDITYTGGGTIVDGSSLVASRYYKITAQFSSSIGGRGLIREIQLKEGIFRYFGSHIDTPFNGVSPQIIKDSVSTLSQKIKIGSGLSTTGESSVRMFWVPEVSDMIASGYLKGKDVAIFSGFVGLPTDAYEPILVGTWYDHTLDEINRVITVKIRDAFKQFEKRKVPEEVVNPSTGAITTPPLTFTTTSLVTVMKQIFDEIGLRDRYISPDFDTLEAGQYSEAKYKVSRSLVKFSTPSIGNPTDFNKLLDELAVTGSMYLVPQGNGQIKPKPFDPNQEHTATLDANEIDFVNLKGNISEFFSRFYAYYNPKTTLTADPTDDTDDYDNGTAVIDVTAEVNWFPERGTKQHFDKWKVGRTVAGTPLTTPPQALTDLMNLWNSLFTEPLYTVSAKKIPPRFANIEPADVIEVDNLDLPVVENAWLDSPSDTGDSFDFGSETVESTVFFIGDDGGKLYIVDDTTIETIYQYSLSTPWDITTASYDSKSLDVSAEIGNVAYGLWLKPDGLKLYASSGTGEIYQYTMSTAWDISTASYDSISGDFTANTGSNGIYIDSVGEKVFVSDSFDSSVSQYTMSTAWDLTTISHDVTASVASQDSQPSDVFLSNNGKKLFIIGLNTSKVYQYSLGTPFEVDLMTYDNANLDVSSKGAIVWGLFFRDDGSEMTVISRSNEELYTYSVPALFDLSSQSYTEGDRVIHDGFMWRARQDSTGKDPTSEPAFWQNTQISDAGLTVGKHFFVLGRKFNPNQATMELDLMEMPPGTLGAFSADEYSTAFDIG